jgi:hypothetical protein
MYHWTPNKISTHFRHSSIYLFLDKELLVHFWREIQIGLQNQSLEDNEAMCISYTNSE